MKGKTTMTIVIGLVCVILTAVIFLQFKTISKIDITALENMQETELRNEIASLKAKNESVIKKLDDTNLKIAEYKDNITNNNVTSDLLAKEVNQLEGLVGLRDISGSGIIITVKEGEFSKVYATDLLDLVYELKLAGAEAISINDQRIVYDSYIVDINDKFISVNGTIIQAPYVVKVIGNATYLESGLSKKQYGYIDTQKMNGKEIELQKSDNIYILKYDKDLNFEKAASVEQ